MSITETKIAEFIVSEVCYKTLKTLNSGIF